MPFNPWLTFVLIVMQTTLHLGATPASVQYSFEKVSQLLRVMSNISVRGKMITRLHIWNICKIGAIHDKLLFKSNRRAKVKLQFLLSLFFIIFSGETISAGAQNTPLGRCTIARQGSELIQSGCDQQRLSLQEIYDGRFLLEILTGHKPFTLLGSPIPDREPTEYILRRMSLLNKSCKNDESCPNEVKNIEAVLETGCENPITTVELHAFDEISGDYYKSIKFGQGVLCKSNKINWMIFDSLFSPLHRKTVLPEEQIESKSDQLQFYIFGN
ncbi:hypothetical protein ACFP4H_12890 [Pseudophaeobacter arcticus]